MTSLHRQDNGGSGRRCRLPQLTQPGWFKAAQLTTGVATTSHTALLPQKGPRKGWFAQDHESVLRKSGALERQGPLSPSPQGPVGLPWHHLL